MEIRNPEWGWLGLVLLIPMILYLLRLPGRVVETSTMGLMKKLARRPERSWLRWLRRWLPLILSLATLGGTVLSLTNPRRAGSADSLRSVVVVLDRSASMGAILPDGGNRLESAKRVLRDRLMRLAPQVSASVVACGGPAEVVCPPGCDRGSVLRAVEEMPWRPVEGRSEEAMALAEELAGQQTPSEIWWVSDSKLPEQAGAGPETGPGKISWSAIPVPGSGRLNVGLTAFQLRPLSLERTRLGCFLEVSGNECVEEGVDVRLDVRAGEVAYPPRLLKLKAGGSEVVEFPVENGAGRVLHVQLSAEGDCLPLDDELRVSLPETKPLVVVRVGERDQIDPFAHVALQSLAVEGELQVWSAEPEEWPVQGADVLVLDHWLPEEWPERVPVVVLDPPRSLGPVGVAPLQQEERVQHRLRVRAPEHPVLFRVDSSRLAVTQTSALELPPGLVPLWEAGRGPLLAAGEWNRQRVVVTAFSPRRSTHLPFTESFPLLLGNAIDWCAEAGGQRGDLPRQCLRPGEVLAVEGREVTWRTGEEKSGPPRSSPVNRGRLELDRTGHWQTDAGESGAVHLLSFRETREAGAPQVAPGPAAMAGGAGAGATAWAGDLTAAILSGVLLLFLLDVWLHRRWAL